MNSTTDHSSVNAFRTTLRKLIRDELIYLLKSDPEIRSIVNEIVNTMQITNLESGFKDQVAEAVFYKIRSALT